MIFAMKRVLLILLLFVVLPLTTIAQSLSNRARRTIYTDVINAIECYEMSATVRDEGAKYNFLNLFRSPDTRIYCDLMDYYSTDNKIEVLEYLDLLAKKSLVEVEIKNIVKGKPVLKNDGWHVQVSFFKTVNYIDENEVWFSSEQYYDNDYQVTIDFVYDENDRRCYIADIDGRMMSDKKHLPKDFVVLQYNSPKDYKLKLQDKKQLVFNEFKQAYVMPADIRPWNDNIHIKYDTVAKSLNYNLMKLRYKATPWRAKLRFAYAVDGMYRLTENPNKVQHKSTAYEMGLDLGITFSMGRSTQVGLYSGAAIQNSEISFSLNDMKYTLNGYTYKPQTGVDFNWSDEGSGTTRYYELSATEGVKYTDLVIPLYLGFDHRLANVVTLNWNVGAKMYLNMSTKVTPYHLKGSVKVDNKEPDVIDSDYQRFLFPSSYGVPQYSFSLAGSMGLSFNLYKRYIYLNTKAGYEFGLGEVHSSSNSLLYDTQTGSHYPLVYSESSEQDVATRSFMDCVSYSRRAIWVEMGLIFKF